MKIEYSGILAFLPIFRPLNPKKIELKKLKFFSFLYCPIEELKKLFDLLKKIVVTALNLLIYQEKTRRLI